VNQQQPELPNAEPSSAQGGAAPPTEGEYLGPNDHPASGRNWRAAGGTAIGIGVLLAKFKGLLFLLLNFKWLLFASKFALTGFSLLLSIWFYALFFGWKFAVAFVLLIAIHETGHAICMRAFGLPVAAMVFVPGFGAFAMAGAGFGSAYRESIIALAGPLFGTLGSLVCLAYGMLTNEPFWYAVAYTGFFLNLFNMVPVGFLDGGRIVGAISPKLWVLGLVILIVAAVAFHWWSPVLLLVIILSIPRLVAVFRGKLDPGYYAVTAAQRGTVTVAYFGLLAIMLSGVVFAHVAVPQ